MKLSKNTLRVLYGGLVVLIAGCSFLLVKNALKRKDSLAVSQKVKEEMQRKRLVYGEGELRVLGTEMMKEVYGELDVKSPQEVIRKEINNYLLGDEKAVDVIYSLLDKNKESVTLNSYGAIMRNCYLLKEIGLIKLSEHCVKKGLGVDGSGYGQVMEKAKEVLGRLLDKGGFDERNTNHVVSAAVGYWVHGIEDHEFDYLLLELVKKSPWQIYVDSSDIGQIYLWQMVALYNPRVMAGGLREKLKWAYGKFESQGMDNPRLRELKAYMAE